MANTAVLHTGERYVIISFLLVIRKDNSSHGVFLGFLFVFPLFLSLRANLHTFPRRYGKPPTSHGVFTVFILFFRFLSVRFYMPQIVRVIIR